MATKKIKTTYLTSEEKEVPAAQRPHIKETLQLRLWLDAGGRCEYPSCNKPLYIDKLTLQPANLANIAHIISFSPKGPRGDKELSPKLSTDISNLMLMCYDHHRLIDHEALRNHSARLLFQYKAEHEYRVKRLLDIKNNQKTYILRFQADIGSKQVAVDQSEVETAVAYERKYPADEKGVLIHIPNVTGILDKCYWKKSAQQIKYGISEFFRFGTNEVRVHSLSVFAIGPMPLLAYLGKCISEIRQVNIFQLSRDVRRWKWKRFAPVQQLHKISVPSLKHPKQKVGVVLSLSDKITPEKYSTVLDKSFDIYELYVDNPSPLYLEAKHQLSDFGAKYRELLNEIQELHGPNCEIHLLVAVPIAVAVTCGKVLLPRKDPTIWIYDYDKDKKGFYKALKLN